MRRSTPAALSERGYTIAAAMGAKHLGACERGAHER